MRGYPKTRNANLANDGDDERQHVPSSNRRRNPERNLHLTPASGRRTAEQLAAITREENTGLNDSNAGARSYELPPELFNLTQVDDAGLLFISPVIHYWNIVSSSGIDTVIDLEGGLDVGVPTVPNQVLYIYFPILDEHLPDMEKLDALGSLGATLVGQGHHVLSHCGMGFNRSALVAGLILHKLGMPGPRVVERLRERRPGALFNERFAAWLESLG